mmetsp:Transcript_68429/g.137611  ORF Transcript_68429/g.137611 Transcript_68429/m.137611 type:complete len:127 (+) Transcript_68429:256-636(+)
MASLRCLFSVRDHAAPPLFLRSTTNFLDAEDAAYAEETALFDQIDADGDGGIDNREMTAALSRMGILGPEMQTIALSKVAVPETSSAEVNQMFSDADGNGDGIIDFAEFATIYKKIKAMAATKNTR